MTTLYEQHNRVYRALDVYNFPAGISLSHQIQALRVLHEHRNRYRGLPTTTHIQTRLQNIAVEVYNSPNHDQMMHELMDTALEFGVSLPMIETQRELFREYERHTVDAVSKPKPKDIYSLEAIVGDSQNVHHASINEHMKTLVRRLVTDFPMYNGAWSILKNELMKPNRGWQSTEQTTLKFIYENPCTFTIGITLRQLMLSVYGFILHQPEDVHEQLFIRMNEELKDMRDKCSTGHMSRLVNVVQGFSEHYTLCIQPKEEIKAFIYHYLNKQLEKAPETIQDGMMTRSQAFKDYVMTDTHIHFFQQRFGTDHTEWITTCMTDYVQPE
jgi:hypothetical protein